MRPQISFLTQSRFYSPAFNAAIFDGPLRIYFAQFQEPQALKIYFAAQQRLQDLYAKIRETFRRTGTNIFVMLYPSREAFEMSFETAEHENILVERLGVDFVVGVKGPLNESDVERVYERVEEIARVLAESSEVGPAVEAAL
jgi:hypothetical protein